MNKTLKKYRIKSSDGNTKIIYARNMHDAKSKARIEFGQLPNDINLKIVKKVLENLQDTFSYLKDETDKLKNGSKDLNWNEVYSDIKNISDYLKNNSLLFLELAGSMVKIKNEENEE